MQSQRSLHIYIIEIILNEIKANRTNNYLILVENKGKVPKNEEKIRIGYLKHSFSKISNKIELFNLSDKVKFNEESNEFKFEDLKTYESFENIFLRLTKGEEQSKECEENGGCRT